MPPRENKINFDLCKRNTLGKLDKSPKGSIDAPIEALVHTINGTRDYVTTSTCSGRISLFATSAAPPPSGPGRWLLVSHELIAMADLEIALCDEALARAGHDGLTEVMMKVEPAILHVQCRSIEAGVELLRIAIAHGFRESGLVLSGSQKVMLAVRTTSNMMEAPVVHAGAHLLSREAMEHLHAEANKRLAANLKALARFERAFSEELRSVRGDALLALRTPPEATPSGRRARVRWLGGQLWNIALCAVCAATGSVAGLAVDAARLALDALLAVIVTSPAAETLLQAQPSRPSASGK